MNDQDFQNYTNKLLGNLTRTSSDYWGAKSEYYNKLKQVLHSVDEQKQVRQHRTTYSVKDGADFRIPLSASSIPYITDVSQSGKIGLTTLEPEIYRFKSGSRLSNKMKARRMASFKKAIPSINKKVFADGIDLDNFTVLNVSDQPMQREHLHYLTQRGGIIPLDKKQGVFIPDFAMKNQSYYSIEYEGRFNKVRDSNNLPQYNTFENTITNPVKEVSGFDPTHLLSHDAGNQRSYSITNDGTIENRRGRVSKEIRIGAAPLSNLTFLMHHTFAAWGEKDIVDPRDIVMDKSVGMHISSTIPNLSGNTQVASNYLKHVGTIIDSLSRTKERWKTLSPYLGIPTGTYNSNRQDFRLMPDSDRLELRYPPIVADTAHTTNQLIMAAKMTSDLSSVIKNKNSMPSEMMENPNAILIGISNTEEHLTNKLLSSRANPIQDWFKKFMDSIGIEDEFNQDFVKKMHERCMKTGARSS